MTAEELIRREQGARLRKARLGAGYPSARSAALENGWKESTYRAHEKGSRTIGHDDAEAYAKQLRYRGASVTAEFILFGDRSAPNAVSSPSEKAPTDIESTDTLRTLALPERLVTQIAREAAVAAIEETFGSMDKIPTDAEMAALVRASLEVFEAQRVLARRQRRAADRIPPVVRDRKGGKADEP